MRTRATALTALSTFALVTGACSTTSTGSTTPAPAASTVRKVNANTATRAEI